MGIESKKEELVKRLSYFDNWEDRYRQILAFAKKLTPMEEGLKTDVTLVKGCLSKVWLHQRMVDDKVVMQADSEAAITKGIISLLVYVYSGQTPQEILDNPPNFLEQVGITEHLSMNRRNGLANMVAQIDKFAKEQLV